MAVRVWRWLEFGFALLALTLLTLACHAMWPDKDGVAAWFQAIGSVAAIGVAIYVPWRQRVDALIAQQQREWQERADSLAQLLLIADEVHRYADAVLKDARPSEMGHKLARTHSPLAHGLSARLTAFQDRATLKVSAALAYEMRDRITQLLDLRNNGDSYQFEPGPPDGDPLGVARAALHLQSAVENVRTSQVEAEAEARAIRKKLAE